MENLETYTKQLVESGLTHHQAVIYELLIKSGGLRASVIVRKLGGSLSRPLVYSVLGELVSLGLVDKDEDSTKVARFIPNHPAQLQDIADERRKKADAIVDAAAAVIPRIASDYNLVSNKPGVLVYDGVEGIKKVINDSLTSKTIVYTFADIESVVKNINEINSEYAKQRDLLGISKKALIIDTPFARAYLKDYYKQSTEIRLIGLAEAPAFQSAMEIYDGKVAYVTFARNSMTGVIIHDPYLYEMNKYFFEYAWEKAMVLE